MSDDIVYRRFEVALPPDPVPIQPADGDDFLDDAATYTTADIWLAVEKVEDDGNHVTVRQFGDLEAVPRPQLSETHPAEILGITDPAPVYPTHSGSPYTSIEDVAEELKEETGR